MNLVPKLVISVFFPVMQTYGHDRSVIVMERADPMLLLVSLPLIPVGLIIGQMIRWEETVSSLRCVTVSDVSVNSCSQKIQARK